MIEDIEKILIDEKQLKTEIANLGRRITKDYAGKNLLLISVLKGSIVFMADLMRNIDLPCEIDFITADSYGNDTKTSGTVKISGHTQDRVKGYDVLIVEDILDSGKTLDRLVKILQTGKPSSIHICTLLDKPERREAPITADYSCFTIPNEFVVGYGLDFAQKFRNLPYIGVLKKSSVERLSHNSEK